MRKPLYQLGLTALLFSSMVYALVNESKTAPGEFPAISMLPPGSVVEGIKLPRYEGPRVAALIEAVKLRVLNRNEVSIEGLLTEIYDKGGFTTTMQAKTGNYDFRSGEVRSTGRTDVHDERFRAQGQELFYSTASSRGHLRGPVRTILTLQPVSPAPASKP